MKFHLAEQDSLRELMQAREAQSKEYLRRERQLYQKKDKLFHLKTSKWGYTGTEQIP